MRILWHAERLQISVHRLFLVQLLPAGREVAAYFEHRHLRTVLPFSVEERFSVVLAFARNGAEAVRGVATGHLYVPAWGDRPCAVQHAGAVDVRHGSGTRLGY